MAGIGKLKFYAWGNGKLLVKFNNFKQVKGCRYIIICIKCFSQRLPGTGTVLVAVGNILFLYFGRIK